MRGLLLITKCSLELNQSHSPVAHFQTYQFGNDHGDNGDGNIDDDDGGGGDKLHFIH